MPKNPQIDAYIAKAPEFAKPIVEYVRECVFAAVPDAEESLKWSQPSWSHNGIVCGIAAFKNHCAFRFWKGELIDGAPDRRIASVKDLPPKKQFVAMIKKAAQLNEEGVPAPAMQNRKKKPPLQTPDFLIAALKKNKKAQAAFDKFPPSHKREYIEWLVEAKTDATRQRRLDQALEWMAEGKSRNWKYQSKSPSS